MGLLSKNCVEAKTYQIMHLPHYRDVNAIGKLHTPVDTFLLFPVFFKLTKLECTIKQILIYKQTY